MTLPSKDVRDGVVFLLGLVLLVLLIVSLTKFTQDETTYTFKVSFPRAQGIQSGAAVQVAGVRVGQVVGTSLQEFTNKSLIEVKVPRNVRLSHGDRYVIATGGLVGEKFLDITPQKAGGKAVRAGDVVDGASTTEMNDLVASTSMLLDKFNTTADRLNVLLSDDDMRQDTKAMLHNLNQTTASSAVLLKNINTVLAANRQTLAAAITDLRATTHSSAEFAAGMNAVLRDNQAALQQSIAGLQRTTASSAELVEGLNQLVQRNATSMDGVVADLSAVAKDIRTVSNTLSPQIAGSKMVQNLDAAAANTAKITERLEKTAAAVETLLNDTELAAGLRESAQHMRAASADLAGMLAKANAAVADLQAVSANMKDATGSLKTAGADLPFITKPFRDISPDAAKNMLDITHNLRQTSADVSGMTGKLTDLRNAVAGLRLEPDGRFVFMADGPWSTRADVNLTLRGASRLARVGVANIDHGNQVNLQAGHLLNPELSLRYGLVQSRPGLGLDLQPNRNLRLTTELFDPRTPRVNLQADYRLPGLGGAWWLTGGIYDLLDARRAIGGGVTVRP